VRHTYGLPIFNFIVGEALRKLKVPELAVLKKNLKQSYGTGKTNKAQMIEKILETPQPPVTYSNEDLRDLYSKRKATDLGHKSRDVLLRYIRKTWPDFDEISRPGMTGIVWLSYVQTMMSFLQANKNLTEVNFQSKFLLFSDDLHNHNPNNKTSTENLRRNWNLLKMLPQFHFFLSEIEIQRYEDKIVKL